MTSISLSHSTSVHAICSFLAATQLTQGTLAQSFRGGSPGPPEATPEGGRSPPSASLRQVSERDDGRGGAALPRGQRDGHRLV